MTQTIPPDNAIKDELQEKRKEINSLEDRFSDIVEFILDENYSEKNPSDKERGDFFESKFTRMFLVPKIKQFETSLYSITDSIRRHDLDIEKLTYAIKSHEKQIIVLEKFIEQQNIKNEQIHFEIANLKISLESIQMQLNSIMGFMERQNEKNEQVHNDINGLGSKVEVIQQHTSNILLSIARIGDSFERHIDDADSFFLKESQRAAERAIAAEANTDKDLARHRVFMKIGYWIAGSLGAISFIALSVYSVATEKSLPGFIIEAFKMIPW